MKCSFRPSRTRSRRRRSCSGSSRRSTRAACPSSPTPSSTRKRRSSGKTPEEECGQQVSCWNYAFWTGFIIYRNFYWSPYMRFIFLFLSKPSTKKNLYYEFERHSKYAFFLVAQNLFCYHLRRKNLFLFTTSERKRYKVQFLLKKFVVKYFMN